MNMLMPSSALSCGFYVDSLKELAILYTEHGFITEDGEMSSITYDCPGGLWDYLVVPMHC